MKYKKSKYNIFVPYTQEETIIFNPFKGTVGLFDKNTMIKYEHNSFNEKEYQILLDKGIYISEEQDELTIINTDRINGICDNKAKLFRIWTTSACNARCYYCFEHGIKSQHLNKSTADATINFISQTLQNGDTLKIEWFGGEPLINADMIDYITQKLLPILKDKNCKYQSAIITNGSLINNKIANKMKNEWNISIAQITLDGYGSKYDQVKNWKNAKENNFDKIIENVKNLADCNIRISIRMNYDIDNYDSLVELINYMHVEFSKYNNIIYYVYPVWSSLDNSFKSSAKADEKYIQLLDLLLNYRMTTLRRASHLNYKKHSCQSCSKSTYTIFPDGKIGTCSEVFNLSFGDVFNGITDENGRSYWYDFTLAEKCESCIYLPLCQGGCKASNFSNMPQCFVYKNIIPNLLKWYISKLKAVN